MRRLHQLGWLLFLLSAVLYAWAGARAGDLLVVAGSVVFGGACVLFLVPERGRSGSARRLSARRSRARPTRRAP
ncbi:hypothetical protein Q6348_10885 [Isoptericola sp. b441]|uniref:Uncharacterized protein n=1 Tax=Actinotalea lenta TaxID=3064654 RepID=A0ABT9D9Z1_9CELL|nr:MULTISPECIES: hypothetical protein [unclassified Isoptericola]MDO8107700.1 hypothetical protein [Isoptericola sp. b441]MDO8120629.1 hypothetical protein [Isoptericola sp. b490]